MFYEVDLPESRSDVLEWITRGDIRHSSFAFQTESDDFKYDGGDLPVRHLISVRVLDTAPVVNPAYPDATCGLRRSLARQFGEDPADVEALAAQGELRRLFVRTDVQPVPELVEARGLSVQQAQLELERLRWDQPRKSGRQAQLELAKLRIDWDAQELRDHGLLK
jgi:hypothetical protein